MPTTTYLGLTYPALSAAPNVPQDMQTIAGQLDAGIGGIILCTSGTRPTAREGATIYETDTNRHMYYDGTTWQVLMPWATTSYTPTWGGATTNPVLGNGTLTGRYAAFGPLIQVQISLILGSTTTTGSGRWTFTLPVASADSTVLAAVAIDDSTTNRYAGSAWVTPGTGVFAIAPGAGGNGFSSSSPFTWTNPDALLINGTYRIA